MLNELYPDKMDKNKKYYICSVLKKHFLPTVLTAKC